jgi:hypothetical protein
VSSQVEITSLDFKDLTSAQLDITAQNYSSFWMYYAARYEFSKEMITRTWQDYLAFFVDLLPLKKNDITKVLVAGVGSGRDAVRLGSIGYCVDILDYSEDFLNNAYQLLESIVGLENTGKKILSPLSTFSPAPGEFYDGILVESALQHLNHTEVIDFLLKCLNWLRPLSGQEPTHQRVLSFRVKKSETGCVYKSVSGVGERYFTTWTEVELQDLIKLLESAGARLIHRKTNLHKDDQQGVPAFEQFVFSV